MMIVEAGRASAGCMPYVLMKHGTALSPMKVGTGGPRLRVHGRRDGKRILALLRGHACAIFRNGCKGRNLYYNAELCKARFCG